MKAVVLTGHGDMSKLVYRTDVPTPKTLGQPPQVLVKVAAAGLNNTDVNTREGWYATTTTSTSTNTDSISEDEDSPWHTIDFPRIQGADVCGHVVAVGSGVESANSSTSLLGKRVLVDPWLRDWDHPSKNHPPGYLGSSADGGFAEYCVVDYRNVHPIDEHKTSLTDAELATFPCSYSTAEGMLERAAVTDDIVLVTGASGGVGGALMQLAKRRGATVVALASPAKHQDIIRTSCGRPPDALLPRAPDNLPAALQTAIGRDSVTVVADVVGGDYFPTLLQALEHGGRYTTSGAITGAVVSLDLRTLHLNDLTLLGSTVIPRHVFENLVGYIEAGEIRPVLADTFALADFHKAQQTFIEKRHTGNIVVIP